MIWTGCGRNTTRSCGERTEWSNNIFREKYIVLSVQRRSIEEAGVFFLPASEQSLHPDSGGCPASLQSFRPMTASASCTIFFRSGKNRISILTFRRPWRGARISGTISRRTACNSRATISSWAKSSGAYCFEGLSQFSQGRNDRQAVRIPQNLMLSIQIVRSPWRRLWRTCKSACLPWRRILPVAAKAEREPQLSAEPPYEMQQMRQEMKALLDDLTSRDQRMVLVLVTLVHLADSYAQLNSDTEAITATARGRSVPFQYAPFPAGGGPEHGAALRPAGNEAMRTMNTESAAALTPFPCRM